MLSIYDLFDLSGIFKNIRSFPNYSLNKEIIQKTIEVLLDDSTSHNINQFRKALQTIRELDLEKYYFVAINNVYVYFPSLLKDETIYELLITACRHLLNAVMEENIEKIIDLADCLHNLPNDIVESGLLIPKFFWKISVKTYRKKWDKNFLRMEQKKLNRQ